MYEKFQISMKGWFDHQIMGFWVMGFGGKNPFPPYPIPYCDSRNYKISIRGVVVLGVLFAKIA